MANHDPLEVADIHEFAREDVNSVALKGVAVRLRLAQLEAARTPLFAIQKQIHVGVCSRALDIASVHPDDIGGGVCHDAVGAKHGKDTLCLAIVLVSRKPPAAGKDGFLA